MPLMPIPPMPPKWICLIFLNMPFTDPHDLRRRRILHPARAEGAGFPAVVAGQAVADQATVAGIRIITLGAPDGSRIQDTDAENEPAPAAPRGGYVGGRATTALIALANGDYAILNFDLSGRLRTAASAPGAGKNAIHVAFNSGALGAGANTLTIHTGAATQFTIVTSVVVRYNGTVAGVTMQLVAGGERAEPAVGGLVTGQDVQLLGAGREVYLDAGETLQVQVEGATATDTVNARTQGVEEAI